MKLTVYDYMNYPSDIFVDKDIELIEVLVVSGDEIGTIFFTDGTRQDFESSEFRTANFFDGRYFVRGEDVAEWNSLHSDNRIVSTSYFRRDYWYDKEDN